MIFKKIISLFIFAFFINLNIVSATTIDDYMVGKYIYYNPFDGEPCSEDNYWTFYNQKTTCYRWAVIDKLTESNKNYIRILLDHDIGLSTFDDKNTVLSNAKKEWDQTYIKDGTFGSLGNNMVLKLYQGSNDNIETELYEINSKWKLLDSTNESYYNKKNPNTTSFMYSNIDFRDKDLNSGKNFNNYNLITNYSYNYSDIKIATSGGYWLTDSIKKNPFGEGNTQYNDYAFYMNSRGNMQLEKKAAIKGVRPVFYLDIEALDGKSFKETNFEVSKTTLVFDGNDSTFKIGEKKRELNSNTCYYPEGFTIVDNDKGFFYLTPRATCDFNENEPKGVLLSIDGENITNSSSYKFDHGNDMHFNKTNSNLYISGASFKINTLKLNGDKTISSNTDPIVIDNGINPVVFAISDDGKYLFKMDSTRRIWVYDLSDGTIKYFFDTNMHSTLQSMAYINGYLYFVGYESCKADKQNYCYPLSHSMYMSVYNVKFNPDGTPNRWFGQNVKTYTSIDLPSNEKVYEIEGVGAYDANPLNVPNNSDSSKIYLGFAKTNTNGTIVPVVYSYSQPFYTVTYKLGSDSYTDEVFPGKFVDMGLYLNNKTHDNGFIGWMAPDGNVYDNPDATSLRITANTELNGVYIEPNSNYTFENGGLNISYRAKVSDVLKDIKAYNATLKIYRNGTDITSSVNEYIKYGDVLKIIPNGNLVNLKEIKYNLYPQKYLVTYNNIINTATKEYTINDKVSFASVTRTGYQLTGFTYNGKNYKLTEQIIMPKNDIILTAIWQANSYTLSYDSISSIKQVTYDSKYGDLPVPTKTGYIFKGWYLENTYKTLVTKDTLVKTSANHKLYAKWEILNSYTIKNYSVDKINKYIDKISINTSVDEFKKNILLANNYIVKVDYKLIDKNSILYTGGKTKIYKNNVLEIEYTNIVRGDITGDAKINYLDYVSVYNHIYKTKHPSSDKKLLINEYLIAADMSLDGKINYLDYVNIYNKIKEMKGGSN